MPGEKDLKCMNTSNVPVQFFRDRKTGKTSIVYYMPRKEGCYTADADSEEAVPQLCKEAALVLRSLAKQIELFGEGKLDVVYYPLVGDEEIAAEVAETALKNAQQENGSGG